MDEMISRILELALEQGIWAVLYIYLFFRMLKDGKERETHFQKDNQEREERYQAIINRLSDNIENRVSHIQETVDEIAHMIKNGDDL